eukprot:CAMPEP_0203767042 /NCGR_PEP_ID=MMETSP0099_2-20121227/768_1 /ASSEMBLY_ACC=CAM_ASM_000209 /TAXON_ID=96639 /ORGANISM=" , Strain NY0313808BC1" /LENGTH=431 /DNA_ID=CAMNT_0050663489 /DNA_START=2177 /DNA_END=3472 /DNA_ORIENTATION=+
MVHGSTWALLVVVVHPLGCGGVTRFVADENGHVRAKEFQDFKPLDSSRSDYSADELANFAFMNFPNAQPMFAKNKHHDARGNKRDKQRAHGKVVFVDSQFVTLDVDGDRSFLDDDDQVFLNPMEHAYLYDEVLSQNRQMKESDLLQRHKSIEGYDLPEWDDLVITWDRLKSVFLRDNNDGSYAEHEIESIFREQGGVFGVRSILERRILEKGRGHPDVWSAWNQLGNTFRATGEIGKAIQCFRRALAIKKDDPDVLLNLAVVVQTLGYLDDAEILIQQAVNVQPNGVLQQFILGNILHEQGNIEGAVTSYKAALSLQPNFIPCIRALRDMGIDVSTHEKMTDRLKTQGISQETMQSILSSFVSEDEGNGGSGWRFSLSLFHVAGFFFVAIGVLMILDWTDKDRGSSASFILVEKRGAQNKKTGNRKKNKKR